MIDRIEQTKEALMGRLSVLAIQTAAGEKDWRLDEYLPIGFLLGDPLEPESSDTIQHSFEASTILHGEYVSVSVCETIYIPSGKSDCYVGLRNEGFQMEWAISFEKDYYTCSSGEVLTKYGTQPIAVFAKAIVPYLVKHCQEEIKEGLLGKRFYNEIGIPEETMELPIVKKAEHLCERDDLLGFHEMVLGSPNQPGRDR